MLRLGVVQMAVLEGKVDENQKKIRDIVRKYAEDDIDLLCFPELCISGYDFKQAEKSDQENEFCLLYTSKEIMEQALKIFENRVEIAELRGVS